MILSADIAGSYSRPSPRRRGWLIAAGVLIVLAGMAAIAGYFYWEHLKTTPQYTLASIVDAAERNDEQAVLSSIDINAVTDAFVPQIVNKAVDLYGRGLPKETISIMGKLAQPLMPAIRERAAKELPAAIRRQTGELPKVPFWTMVLGAKKYLDIRADGDKALVRSLDPDRPAELTMERRDGRWVVTGVRDDALAEEIARKIGEELIAIGNDTSTRGVSAFGIKNVDELIRKAEELFNNE